VLGDGFSFSIARSIYEFILKSLPDLEKLPQE
jgi:hypothetical protein